MCSAQQQFRPLVLTLTDNALAPWSPSFINVVQHKQLNHQSQPQQTKWGSGVAGTKACADVMCDLSTQILPSDNISMGMPLKTVSSSSWIHLRWPRMQYFLNTSSRLLWCYLPIQTVQGWLPPPRLWPPRTASINHSEACESALINRLAAP